MPSPSHGTVRLPRLRSRTSNQYRTAQTLLRRKTYWSRCTGRAKRPRCTAVVSGPW